MHSPIAQRRDHMQERAAYANHAGKWVPQSGWLHVGVYDAREHAPHGALPICEMCETAPIRFVHRLLHPAYGTLKVGCVCAQHLTGDDHIPYQLERAALNRAIRRARYATSKKWKATKRGTPYIGVRGYRMTILKIGAGYRIRVKRFRDGAMIMGGKTYPNVVAAKMGCADAVAYLRNLAR